MDSIKNRLKQIKFKRLKPEEKYIYNLMVNCIVKEKDNGFNYYYKNKLILSYNEF